MNRKLMYRINTPSDSTPREIEDSQKDLIKLLAREVYNFILDNPDIVTVTQNPKFDLEGKKCLPYIELRASIELSNYDVYEY